ncbi:hypothetical protein HanRHA438_Chr09g0378251 [Helianthus annuus]|nr:hypothetical protein HanRHA438_Chr09g0378251 [Helianthus annuus]
MGMVKKDVLGVDMNWVFFKRSWDCEIAGIEAIFEPKSCVFMMGFGSDEQDKGSLVKYEKSD